MPEKWLKLATCKKKKNNLRIISKPHAYFQTMTKTPMKFRKNWYKNCRRSCAHKVPPVHSLCYRQCQKNGSVQLAKESDTNNLRIISKPHAYLHTMTKTLVKFQKNRYKTVGGVAPTRYPLSIHFVIIKAEYIQTTRISSYIRPLPKH